MRRKDKKRKKSKIASMPKVRLPFVDTEGAEPADFTITVLVTILVIFGTVMIFSASYYTSLNSSGSPFDYLKKQLVFAAIGAVLMVWFSYFDYHKFIKLNLPLMVVTVLLLVAVIAGFGTTVNGATRWIYIGPISIMPGEFAKVSAIIFTATWLRTNNNLARDFIHGLVPIGLYTALLAGLIIKQPNLSTAITLVGIVFVILWMAGLQYGCALLGIGGVVGLMFGIATFAKNTYWAERILSFLDPFKDASGDGFQVVQSLLALGSGGLFGKGIGRSVQKTLYLPSPQNDFILAIVGEELGFVGVVILLIIFVLLVWRTLMVAVKAPDKYGMLLSGGVAGMLGLQVILNVAVVTSSMPPTGVALPFISYGGNSLWIFMASYGVVLNVSRQTAAIKKQELEEPEYDPDQEYRDFYERNHLKNREELGR